MDCRSYEILINKELDGALSPEERSRLLSHLDQCPACAAQLAEYRRMDGLLYRVLPQVETPAELTASVMESLPEKPTQLIPRWKQLRTVWKWVGVGVAAAAVALTFGLSGWLQGDDPAAPLGKDPVKTPVVAEEDPKPVPVTPPVTATPPEEDAEQEEDLPKVEDPATTDAPVVAENETPPKAQVQQPPTPTTPPDTTHNNDIPLPQVTSGAESHGAYSLLTLAAVEGYDAILPRVSGSTVNFYVKADDAYLEYEADIQGAAPVFLGETESLPSAAGIAGCSSGEGYVEAKAGNGLVARSYSGEKQGLWLVREEEESQVSEKGGGSLVSWSGDGNKVLFTDGSGLLHLYYVAENIELTLTDSAVRSFCWGPDGKAVVFAAQDSGTGHSCVFKVIVP